MPDETKASQDDETYWQAWRNPRGNRRGWHRARWGAPPGLLAAAVHHSYNVRTYPKCTATARHNGQPCGQMAMSGRKFCRFHAPEYYARRFKKAGANYGGRADKPAPAPPAPQELRALPVWKRCRNQRARNALAQAFANRETDPSAWRRAVASIMQTGGMPDASEQP